jgi:hypothetical protein
LADREPVYSFGFRELPYALTKANMLLIELREHSSNILIKEERTRLVGRKIYYDRTPAIITRFMGDQGSIMITAEKGRVFPQPIYVEDDDERDDDHNSQLVKEDLLSAKIWWHRKKD